MMHKLNKFGNACARMFFVKQPTITRGLIVALVLSVSSLICLSYYVSSYSSFNRIVHEPPQPTIKCLKDSALTHSAHINNHSSAAQLRVISKVLVLVETQYTTMGQEIIAILEANRIKYKAELAGKSLPYLTHMDKGKFGAVIFERFESYLNMDKWNRQLLDKYCREYKVGIIAFARPEEPVINAQVKDFPLFVHTKLALRDYWLNPDSSILRITRAGDTVRGPLPGDDWTVFVSNHSTYKPLAFARVMPEYPDLWAPDSDVKFEEIQYVTVVQDEGTFDGIQRVIFGNGFKFWLHRLLFLDALSCLSHGKFSIPLERYMLIDIDDIFVGKLGTRMKPEDVKAMLSAQTRLQRDVDGFHFNLGFSGKYFHRGTEEENRGDDALIELKGQVWWFPHMWRHLQPHNFETQDALEAEMMRNRNFAQKYGIPVNMSYAVAPHHSGVYPVHEELYEVWKRVWGVKVTSTEEYPHLRPARHRRGFIHRNIMVLPRQTCGLFTHTIHIDKYPGGRERLEHSIRGGELFLTILFNPVSVFMTHLSNYGNDRLALYTFESVVKFLRCWTNLRLKTQPPVELAQTYFDMYPEEEDPIWRNPCDDKRHESIWSSQKSCNRLPNTLVIGPQKTGTTALYAFLSMHPSIMSNVNSPATFEEVQFFNGKNYYRGLDWYMQFFPLLQNHSSKVLLFEKSANYFDSEAVPERAFSLLPRAKLITILSNPAKRAYSWYQHQIAHNDKIALSYSFYEVVMATEDSPRPLRDLRHRCLNPGLYAHHLERWLDLYPPKQLLILDGEQLKLDPIAVMDKVQRFLRVEPHVSYSKMLKFNPKKGFFCQVVNGDNTKCLGRSKGRIYPPMEANSEAYLRNFYRKHNIALSKLLTQLDQPVFDWLEEELGDQR